MRKSIVSNHGILLHLQLVFLELRTLQLAVGKTELNDRKLDENDLAMKKMEKQFIDLIHESATYLSSSECEIEIK